MEEASALAMPLARMVVVRGRAGRSRATPRRLTLRPPDSPPCETVDDESIGRWRAGDARRYTDTTQETINRFLTSCKRKGERRWK